MEEENKIYIKRIKLFLKENPPFKSSQTHSSPKWFKNMIETNKKINHGFILPGITSSQKKFKEKYLKIKDKILFRFKHSFSVMKDGIFTDEGDIYNFDSLKHFKIEKTKYGWSKYYTKSGEYIGKTICLEDTTGVNLKKFLFYLYGERDKEVENIRLSFKKFEVQRSKELEELKGIISITKELVDLTNKQNEIKIENELKYKIIVNEKVLNHLPNQTYGSVIFYNELNNNSTLFDTSQFNKITRFLNHIENHEKKYLQCYDNCVKVYTKDPNNESLNNLVNELETIHNYYEIMKSLIQNVNSDKVLFNKLYNIIEDEGVFMTKTEKETLNYMKSISSGILSLNYNIVDGFNILNRKIQNLNDDINVSMWDIESSIGNMTSSLDDVYMNLPKKGF